MLRFTLGFIAAFVLIAVCGYTYLAMGFAPVATASRPLPGEVSLTHMALHATINKQAPKNVPLPADETNLAAGARIYRTNCAACHGLPDQLVAPIAARGLFPKPPQFFTAKDAMDDPPGATYWVAANGIRLTGMPAFKGSLSDTELWQVTLLLANADKLSPKTREVLSAPQP